MKRYSKSDKSFLALSLVLMISVCGWSGCYIQFAANSDDAAPVEDQNPSPEPDYPHPWYPPPPEIEPPHRWNSLPPAGSTSPVSRTNPPSESPHRQSGYQRSPSADQNNSRQADATSTRTSWSPAPTPSPSTPAPGPGTVTRTSVPTRGGR